MCVFMSFSFLFEIFRSGAPLWLTLSVCPSVRLYEIRRTIEITFEPIEISSPNFIYSFTGQFHTYFIFWPLTSKVKHFVKRSKLDILSVRIMRTIEITFEPVEISSPNFIFSFTGQFYTHFIFWPFTYKVKHSVKRSKLYFCLYEITEKLK